MIKNDFARILLDWNQFQNSRQMPWKGEKDPYKIWISEIILQQTRVDQGLEYYNRFIKRFPDVQTLAHSSDEQIFKEWEGLGYYSRCRNLIASARFISSHYADKFPSDYESILALRGVGPYTAAAISSFAYNLPYAVVDGNVYRVLSRVFGIDVETDSNSGKKIFNDLAEELLDKEQAGLYNQSIMDFGATVCKPTSPLCNNCPFIRDCFAYLNKRIDDLPLKKKKPSIRKRWFYYVLIREKHNEHIFRFAIRKRTSKDIWQDLFEFPLIETKLEMNRTQFSDSIEKELGLKKNDYKITNISQPFKQQLTHQLISGRFINIDLRPGYNINKQWLWIEKSKLAEYPFPQYINQYLEEIMDA